MRKSIRAIRTAVVLTCGVLLLEACGDGSSTPAALPNPTVVPTLEFVNDATRPSGSVGSVVSLEGDAFGDVQGTGQVLFSDGVGGTVPAVIATADDWANTGVVTTVPSGAADGPIAVMTATGTSDPLPFDVTSPSFDATTISWSATQDLPVGLSRHDAVSVLVEDAGGAPIRFVHVLGGASNGAVPLAEVYFATVQPGGTLGAWSTTVPLPAGRSSHAVAAATPFNSKVAGNGVLYVLGGIDTVGGQPVTSVYRGSLNEDGTVDGWTQTQPLPEPLHSLGVTVYRGAVYVVGGATTDNAPVASVYRARPGADGELGAWEALSPLPSARAYHDVAMFEGFLYSVGGESGAVDPDDATLLNSATKLSEVAYVAIDPLTGDFTTTQWTVNTNALGEGRSKHSTLVAGPNVLVTSGLYAGAGTGSVESVFAPINADGSVATFSEAGGANSLLIQGGANLFNQAALSYVDANEVAHVIVLGGDNVNLPGSKRARVLFAATSPSQGGGNPQLPDLIVWTDYLRDVSMEGTSRKLLRFSNSVPNIGVGPLELYGLVQPDGTTFAYQRVWNDDGSYSDYLAGTFVFAGHEDHNHWHFADFANYNLRSMTPDGGVGAIVATSQKVSFCLEDTVRYDPNAGPRRYTCDNQGITVGWADVYGKELEGQWIDITSVPNGGPYWLESVVDPENRLRETDDSSNASRIRIAIDKTTNTVTILP